ncbi:hypothetical protein C6P77_18445 [Burkholderia ambifaria]|nr:hypothetical protein C6P77_18445 [Burkholderia ambifaria]
MEQISGTVERSAAAALEADQRSGIATQMASRGGEVVADAVGTMNEIETASDRIGAIISVIDGIAFQTNILALNAAVEAARAGDQGRGFAVVAHEVRSLAQRSAQAAREVKQLVEETVSRVEAALVHQAGETMGKIVADAADVQSVVSGIARSATEQTRGIQEVNRAVMQLDEMVQQNAALVEESAAIGSCICRFADTGRCAGAEHWQIHNRLSILPKSPLRLPMVLNGRVNDTSAITLFIAVGGEDGGR